MSRRVAIAVISMAVVVAATLAGLGVWLAVAVVDEGTARLNPEIFDVIESDPVFSFVPPGASAQSVGRRLECEDSSGDMPTTWRDFETPLADERVLDLYAERAVDTGWTEIARWAPEGGRITSGASFLKRHGRYDFEMDVYAFEADDGVQVSATVTCPTDD